MTTSTRRIRLIKHLRTHGFSNLEHLREDELDQKLSSLKLCLPEESALRLAAKSGTSASAQPSSHTLQASRKPPAQNMGPALSGASPLPESDLDDPHALPRFQEPKIFLPEGERSFLRLIPVDGHSLFVTWDLSAEDRAKVTSPVALHFRHLDNAEFDHRVDIDLAPGGWYVSVRDEGARMQCDLLVGHVVLLTSNVAQVPPLNPAPSGPVVYASLSPQRSRKDLAAQGLLDAIGNTIEGISLEVTEENGRVPDFLDAKTRNPSSDSLQQSSSAFPSSR